MNRHDRPVPSIRVATAIDHMLAVDTVYEIYAAAAAMPPLSEPPSVAKTCAELYRRARAEPGATMTIATIEDQPVGFAYGHDWSWERATDSWALALRDRLGATSQALESSFTLELLAVHPTVMGRGIGRSLLSTLIHAVQPPTAWLFTTYVRSPARSLYRSCGWHDIGQGPDAPNGEPGAIMAIVRGQ